MRNSWQESNNRTNNVIGRDTSTEGFRGAPPPSRVIFVSRVVSGEKEVISNFIKSRGVNVINIEKTSHEDATFSSYKICISVLDKEKVFDPKFWPAGVKCRMWRERKERNQNNNYPYNFYNYYSDFNSDSDSDTENEYEDVPNNADDNADDNAGENDTETNNL